MSSTSVTHPNPSSCDGHEALADLRFCGFQCNLCHGGQDGRNFWHPGCGVGFVAASCSEIKDQWKLLSSISLHSLCSLVLWTMSVELLCSLSVYRILEKFRLEGTLKTSQFLPPCHGQGLLLLEQAAPSRVLAVLGR